MNDNDFDVQIPEDKWRAIAACYMEGRRYKFAIFQHILS